MIKPLEPLAEGEVELKDDETLFRQITVPMWDDKRSQPASVSFGPSTADQGMPSFARSSAVTAEESQRWHNENAAKESLAVWGCTVLEVIDSADTNGAQTRVVDDAAVPPPPGRPKSPGHCYVDYRHLTKDEERDLRAQLLMRALARGELLGRAPRESN